MKQAGRGNFVFVGATASRRQCGDGRRVRCPPRPRSARSPSRWRGARPRGDPRSLIVIDGVVDLPRTRPRMPDKPDAFFVRPDDVAATAAFLVGQPRSAWTFELEARPFGETW